MRTVAIVNQKGGCGKTTTAINLAGVLASHGLRTLLVDMDPQSHCAAGLAIPEENLDMHIGDAMLLEHADLLEPDRLLWRVRRTLTVAPSAVGLAGIEAGRGPLAAAADRDTRLAGVLDRLAVDFDWCIIDCPPSIGLLTFNALRAADEALIPVETAFLAMHGAARQTATLRSLGKRLGQSYPFSLVATMHDPDSELAHDARNQLKERFGDRLCPNIVRLDPAVREATARGIPVIEHAPETPAAHDYSALAQWLTDPTRELVGDPLPPEEDSQAAATDNAHAARNGAVNGTAHASSATSSIASAPVQIRRTTAEAFATTPRPQQTTPKNGVSCPLGRVADLTSRAKKLMERSVSMQQRLDNDPWVAAATQRRTQEADNDSTARLYGSRETAQGTLFVQPLAQGVALSIAGDFNNWDAATTPMRRNEQLGVHEICIPLPPGRHEYRIVADGVWLPDPHNTVTTPNGLGDVNSVVITTRGAGLASAAQ